MDQIHRGTLLLRMTLGRLAALAILVVLGGAALVFATRDHASRHVLVLGCPHERGESEAAEEEHGEKRCRNPEVESTNELLKFNSAALSRDTAPGTALKPGAYRAAARTAAEMQAVGGTWKQYGNAPLIADAPESSFNEGFKDVSGRATTFTRKPDGTLYVAVSNGGIWESNDNAKSWHSIADNLPTQTTSGVAWTPANGGTLLVLTGDNAYGGGTYAGLGVYRTTDDGATW